MGTGNPLTAATFQYVESDQLFSLIPSTQLQYLFLRFNNLTDFLLIDKIEFIPDPQTKQDFDGQVLNVITELNGTSVMDLPPTHGHVHLWTRHEGLNQQWHFILDRATNTYTIQNQHATGSGRFLAEGNHGTLVLVSNITNAARWQMHETDSGVFEIVNLASNLCLDVYESQTANGTRIQTFRRHGGANQRWRLQRV